MPACIVLPRDATSAMYANAMPYVCPSDCLSVTTRCSVNLAESVINSL